MIVTIPQQFFGAGDAIFIQSLLKQLGGKVLYPILPQFVDGFNRAYPDVTFIDYRLVNVNYESKVEVQGDGYRVLPIRYADQILKQPYWTCMKSKYQLYGLDFNMWRDVKPQRYLDKEYELANKLGIAFDGYGNPNKYNLISPYYGSNSQFKAPIEVNNGLPNIYMNSIEGYSIFDWQVIIENAFTIHAVSSSIVYLLELLELRATEVHLYPRHMEKDTWWKNIEYLTTKKYEIH